MTDLDHEAVLGLDVSQDQTAFVEPMAETFATTARYRDNYVIEADGVIVGYFQIDCTSHPQLIDNHLALHEVQVDSRQQGRGFGKMFAEQLRPFLSARYPDWDSVCLTVNCKNQHAYRLYAYGGFVDTGDLDQEGRSGPQHIMRMDLNRGE